MSRFARLLTAALVVPAIGVPAALALPSAPSLKPREEFKSAWISAPDLALLSSALDAADADRWGEVRVAMSRISDPTARLLLHWRMATDGDSAMSFTDLSRAAEDFKTWPDRDRILEAAEIRIATSTLTSAERIAWLAARGPTTGEGYLGLADAYHSSNMLAERERVIRDAWRTRVMSPEATTMMEAQFGPVFTPEDNWARVDMLLWRGSISAAQSLLGRLSGGRRLLAEARIGVMQNKKTVDALVQAVPTEYQNDPGLLLERARWREKRGQDQGELELLLRIRGADAAPAGRAAIWNEKHSVIRRLIRERDYTNAYALAIDHGLSDGEAFRDAEWTAGWLALEKLNQPLQAEGHFRHLSEGVQTPISIARANYWLGEALQAQNRPSEAQSAYAVAARYGYVFYGQLAAEKIAGAAPGIKVLALAPIAAPTEAERAAFAQRPAVRAAILLAETGRLASFERFSNQIDDMLETPVEHQMLFDIAQGYLETRAAVRGGKAGLQRGLVAPDAVFPVLDLPKSPRTGSAEPALVLALSRQESEFNPRAISGADARGLMQMIPRYAQAEARMVGLPFRQSWLTDDPAYNLRLGRGFLDDLVDEFNGSYILAAAAYNAGPTRARQWIRDFGDPRGQVDPVDWIESIPFAETRNYIQRVLENTQVYRHRLTGQPTTLRLLDDLKRGRP
jgi:soluble lytic murein transglycosylase